jgi:hypothetical protein
MTLSPLLLEMLHRHDSAGSITDEFSQTTVGIYKIGQPKQYQHNAKFPSQKYGRRHV